MYTHEVTSDEFESWEQVGVVVRSGQVRGPQNRELRGAAAAARSLVAVHSGGHWLIAQDLEPFQRREISYCHRTVDILGFLLEYKSIDCTNELALIAEAEDLFRKARSTPADDLMAHIESTYGVTGITGRCYDRR